MTLLMEDSYDLVVLKTTLKEQDYNPILKLLLNLSSHPAFNTPFAKTFLKCSKPTLNTMFIEQPIRDLLKRAAVFKECFHLKFI
jgi:hypothetical protein